MQIHSIPVEFSFYAYVNCMKTFQTWSQKKGADTDERYCVTSFTLSQYLGHIRSVGIISQDQNYQILETLDKQDKNLLEYIQSDE